jgi:hypothetical protein
MRNTKGSFGRIDGEYDYFQGEKTCPDWLSRFANKLAKEEEAKPKTAVEVARDRQLSIYDQMASILSGNRPRFATVEDVVEDYRKRTGLDTFKKANIAKQIIENSLKAEAEAEELDESNFIINDLKDIVDSVESKLPSLDDDEEYLVCAKNCLDQAGIEDSNPIIQKIKDLISGKELEFSDSLEGSSLTSDLFESSEDHVEVPSLDNDIEYLAMAMLCLDQANEIGLYSEVNKILESKLQESDLDFACDGDKKKVLNRM